MQRTLLIGFREASNLESEVKGLHENMKTVLKDNLQLKTEVLRWRSQRESERANINFKSQAVEKRRLDELEMLVNHHKEEAAAYESQLEGKTKQLEQQEKLVVEERMERLRLEGEKARCEAEAEDLRIGSKTLHQVEDTAPFNM